MNIVHDGGVYLTLAGDGFYWRGQDYWGVIYDFMDLLSDTCTSLSMLIPLQKLMVAQIVMKVAVRQLNLILAFIFCFEDSLGLFLSLG